MTRAIFPTGLLLLCFTPQLGYADDCRDRFTRLLIHGNGDEPVKIHVTQEIVGGQTSTNYFYQSEPGHWMTEMLVPKSQPWVLTHDNVMYSSQDKGESWTELRMLDSGNNQANAKDGLREDAKTANNAVCGEDTLDGVVHDTVEADYLSQRGAVTEVHAKYWVDRESGYITKTFYHMKNNGFESMTTQLIERAPDLILPVPE
ncbi:hypothetical protein [Ahrensia marina]|uniref:Uncharacterized protein n=1 Tax=Ahrensia marina TaxID=1514904 RepID=A0A0M9GNR1_9HYPH|nr:hypothetical protein [Ahrensia marina]KPB01806.1 hypothetical protein SU32_05365 [Ahrensia marina]